MPSSDRGLGAAARRSALRLTNQQSSDGADWQDRACRTFGSPWLELVLRAGRAHQLAAAVGNESQRALVVDGTARVWAIAEDGQDHHRRAAARGDRPALRRIADAHADLARFVESLERIVTQAEHARIDDSLTASLQELAELQDKLEATQEATAELDRF